jgi:hypothetical protein
MMFIVNYDEKKDRYFVQIADFVEGSEFTSLEAKPEHTNRFGYWCDKVHLRTFYEKLKNIFDPKQEEAETNVCPLASSTHQLIGALPSTRDKTDFYQRIYRIENHLYLNDARMDEMSRNINLLLKEGGGVNENE